jgi:tellurite methyltransferase
MGIGEDYWNNIYTDKPYQTGKGPSEFLQKMFPRLQKGKTLDIGMGEGQNAVFLAQKGFQVKGFDISPTAIEHACQLAKDTNVSIEANTGNLDFFIFGLLEYDTIVMSHFRPSVTRYYSEIIRALKQGGTLFIESLSVDQMTEPLGDEDAYKNFYYKPNELLKHLKGLRISYYNEGAESGKKVVQCVAHKPLDKDAAKYGLFDMSSEQKNKGKSAQHELAEALFKKKN